MYIASVPLSVCFQATGDRDGMVWYPVVEGDVELEEVPVTPTSTRSTQTEGIFYKSSQTIQQTVNRASQRQHEMEESKFGSRKVSLPLLEFSPGSGYWRQQIDHITQHLKVHAANSQQFKESIGFQQMGKVQHYAIGRVSFRMMVKRVQ